MARADVLSEREVQAMIQYALERKKTRDAALVALGAALGLRISDLLRLRWADVLDENGRLRDRIYLHERKNKSTRVVRPPRWLAQVISAHLQAIGGEYDPQKPIFSITRQRAWQIVVALAKACNVRKTISTHSLRKAYCTVVYSLTRDPVLACVFTGHKNPSQLLTYIGFPGPTVERIWMEYASRDWDLKIGNCQGGAGDGES